MSFPLHFRAGLALSLLCFLSVAARAADEEYNLRGPAPVKGQVITLSNKTNYKNAVRTIKSGDRAIEEDRFSDVTMKEKETEVLAVENGVAKHVRIKIIKDISEEARQKGKRTVRRTRENRLHGQVLFGERAKDEWKYTLDDVTPTPEQKQALKEYQPFRGEDELLPAGKVKVGHEWKFGAKEFQKVLGNQFRDIAAKGTGKFLRVEKEGEDLIAVLELEFELTGKSEEDGLKLDVTLSGKHTVHRSLKTGYDVKGTGTGKVAVKGKGEVDGQKVEVEFSADVTEEETVKVKSSR